LILFLLTIVVDDVDVDVVVVDDDDDDPKQPLFSRGIEARYPSGQLMW
jgi:hypothetical protein